MQGLVEFPGRKIPNCATERVNSLQHTPYPVLKDHSVLVSLENVTSNNLMTVILPSLMPSESRTVLITFSA